MTFYVLLSILVLFLFQRIMNSTMRAEDDIIHIGENGPSFFAYTVELCMDEL